MSHLEGKFFVILAFMALFGASSPALAATNTTIDGVLHVQNPSTPSQGLETWTLQEQWRVGGEDGDDIFGLLSQVISDEEKKVYLLDTQLAEVAVFSADGERINTLSRQGEGPGETNMPADLFFFENGNIGLVQVFPGTITVIDRAGDPVTVIKPGGDDPTQGGFIQLFDVKPYGDKLIIGGVRASRTDTGQSRTHFVAIYDLDGKLVQSLASEEQIIDFNNTSVVEADQYYFDFRHWAVSKDGRVYIANKRNDYQLTVYNPDGSIDRVIKRDYDSYKRTAAEKDRQSKLYEGQYRRVPVEITFDISDTEQDIPAVYGGPDGNIWVTTSAGQRNQSPGVMMTWDVFHPDGEFLKQVAIKCSGDGVEDMMVFPSEDNALLITGFLSGLEALQTGGASGDEEDDDEAAPMEAIYYSISR